MAMEFLNGLIIGLIKELGIITKCMAPESTHGQMARGTQGNTSMISNTGTESFIILTERYTRESGLKVSNTE